MGRTDSRTGLDAQRAMFVRQRNFCPAALFNLLWQQFADK
jgi:hypothetical protein